MAFLNSTFLACGQNQFNLCSYCRMFSLSAEKDILSVGLFSSSSVKGYGWVDGWENEWVIGLIDWLPDWLSLACLCHTVKMKYWFQKHYRMYEYIFTIILFINSVSTLIFSRSHTNRGASRSSTAVVQLVPGTDLCLYGLQLWSVHWLLSMNFLTILCLTCRGLVQAFSLWHVHGMDLWRLLSSLRRS